MTTYEDAKNKFDNIEAPISEMLGELTNCLNKGKNDKHIPIYAIKSRLKTVNGIYLKTKRTLKSFEDIEDYGGLRVLCLFHQDIHPVFNFLLKKLHELQFNLRQVEIYEWGDIKECEQFKYAATKTFANCKCESKPKASGYKSIHLIVYRDKLPIEIQVRTLLQDVWAELEHELSYKQGNIHSHIKQSFLCLASDLGTNDKIITHLRDISDKEKSVAKLANIEQGPYWIFSYEEKLLPNLLKNAIVGSLRQTYEAHIKADSERGCKEWITIAKDLLNAVFEKINVYDEKSDEEVQYWIKMEEAYLLFADKDHSKALEIYQSMDKEKNKHFSDRYILHFRIGEIHFINGNIENSLIAFDLCEEKMAAGGNVDPLNEFVVKLRLAHVYWWLGEQYMRMTWKKISEAEKIYIENMDGFPDDLKRSLVNELAWYSVEQFILSQKKYSESCRDSREKENAQLENRKEVDELYKKAKDRYNNLEQTLTDNSDANSFDTAAWFCYHAWIYENKIDYLNKAKKYCIDGWSKRSTAIHAIHSFNIRRLHAQEIMCAIEKLEKLKLIN